MPVQGFHTEWVTIGEHRILLECRASFPDDLMKRVAKAAVDACHSHPARIVQVYYDDKSCIYSITVASDDKKDTQLEDAVDGAVQQILDSGNCRTQVVIVEPGDQTSDHYHHTEHLSVGAGVAVDRRRQSDEEYMKTVRAPH